MIYMIWGKSRDVRWNEQIPCYFPSVRVKPNWQIPIAIVESPLKITNKEKKVSNRSAVFGGAGFIGTNLVYQLIEDGQQVFNFDNLSGLGNLLNIAELMQQSRHSFARCDISNPEEIRQALLMAAADTIYFCITPKNPEEESSF